MYNNYMRIGVVLNILDEEYQISVYKGIEQKAQNLGVELICFQQENSNITEEEPVSRFPKKEYFDLLYISYFLLYEK